MKTKIAIIGLLLALTTPSLASTYGLDRAQFASSTDWFLVENYPTPKKIDPARSLYFRRFYFVYVDDSLQEGQRRVVGTTEMFRLCDTYKANRR
jgi:hypothetical protein